MTKIKNNKLWIDFHFEGQIPEKEFILVKRAVITQSPELYDWQRVFKKSYIDGVGVGYTEKDINGDLTREAYTPLRVQYLIHTNEENKSLIKQVKAVNDALEGLAFENDCSIVDLLAAQIKDDKNYIEVKIRPYDKAGLTVPEDEPIKITTYLRPLLSTAIYPNGKAVDRTAKEKDDMMIEKIRNEIDEKNEKLIDDDFTLHAIIGIKEIKKIQPISKITAQLNYEEMPVCVPDLDNITYALLHSLDEYSLEEKKMKRLHIYKSYFNPESDFRSKIWIS